MRPLARPASAWIGALLATAVALGLIAMDAGHLATRADGIELGLLKALAPQGSGPVPDWPALAGRLAAPMRRLTELAGLAIFGLGLVLVIAWRGLLLGLAFLVAVVAGTLLLTFWLFLGPHLLLLTLASVLALIAAYGAAVLWQGLAMARWRLGLAAMFDGMLSRQTLQQLLHVKADDAGIAQGTPASCLALKLSASAAEADPDPTRAFNARLEVLARLAEIAKRHGGLLSEFGPRGFNVVWNVLVNEPQHGARACTAALAMVQELGPQRLTGAQIGTQFELAIGIATGSLSAGQISLGRQRHYLIAGSCAEHAQELCDRAKRLGITVLVCGETRNLAAVQYAFLEVERTASQSARAETATGLYALWGPLAVSSSPKFRALAVFHDRLFQALHSGQWASARELITQARKLSGASQRLYDHYAEHLGWLEQHPPAQAQDVAHHEPLTR